MNSIPRKAQATAVAAGLFLVAGYTLANPAPVRRQQLVSLLVHEMQSSTGWVQVHAADALLDHGETNIVASVFTRAAEDSASPFRVGVSRVMARAGQTKQARHAAVENIREVLRDPLAVDRLQAAESLAKLGLVDAADQNIIQSWLPNAAEPIVPFLRWALALSKTGEERAANETALGLLLDAKDPVTRLRAAAALGRLKPLAPPVLLQLRDRLKSEPAESIGRAYIITANLRQAGNDAKLKRELIDALQPYLTHGKPNEQLEAAIAIGQWGDLVDSADLAKMLRGPEADERIGAASGLLYLLK